MRTTRSTKRSYGVGRHEGGGEGWGRRRRGRCWRTRTTRSTERSYGMGGHEGGGGGSMRDVRGGRGGRVWT